MNRYSIGELLQELNDWFGTPIGKRYIEEKSLEIQEAGEAILKDAEIKPEKLKMVIGI